MTDSIALQAVDAAIEALNEEAPTGMPEAGNRRHLEGEKVTEPRIGVFLGDESVLAPRQNSVHDPLARRQTVLAVQCIGVTDDIEKLDECVDPMLQHVVATLGRSNLEGLVYSLREQSTTRRAYYMDTYVMVLTVVFEMSYQTKRDDLTERS